ncbi:restriction endonuclease subunit S [Terasakiella pusilla]|uniref:restriction endonuclease subunit S n=1 Tax=Terasakiella pusilla TaxID=64973 RepID=UPI003AA94D28
MWVTEDLISNVHFIDYRGKTPPKVENGVKLITAKNVKMGYVQEHPEEYIDANIFDEWMTRGFPQEGDVLFTTEAPLGNVAQLGRYEKVAVGQRLITMQPNEQVLDKTFLKYLLLSPQTQEKIHAQATGATVLGIKSKLLKKIPISYPPLEEQKRIVGLLDEAFEGIDQAIKNTEQNLQNARDLFASYLNNIFTQKGEGWRCGPLSKIGADIKTGPFGSLLHKSDYVENGIPLINPAHINEGQITPDMRKTVNQEALGRLRSYQVKINDVVIGRRGEMGRCAPVTEKEDGWLCGTGSFIISPKFENVAQFLSLLLSSNYYKEKITELASGATMLNLSNKALGSLEVALPSSEEQKEILNHINKVTIDQHKLNSIYSKKLTALKELKQSLLQKAFAGELTARDREVA